MSIADSFLAELQHEAESTRRMLSVIPANPEWKPHPKSMSLGNLVRHITELPGWVAVTIHADELDFAKSPYTPRPIGSAEEALTALDEEIVKAVSALQGVDDAALMQPWSLRNGEHIFFTLPKVVVLRNVIFNHLVHHRGQLSVYLRLLDIPVPGVYGPSADDQNM